MPVTTPVKIDSGDTFRITNVGTTTYTFVWNRRTWVLQPNQSDFIPFDVVRLYFGDPRSIIGTSRQFQDSKGIGDIPKREDEIRRLAILYGLYEDRVYDVPSKAPLCEIVTAAGDKLVLPINDPTGHTIPNQTNAIDINNIDDLGALIAQQQQQINDLMAHRDHIRDNGPNSTDDVTVDGDDEGINFA